ncbi:MAG: hypothetical protein WAR77_03885 [Saprospiraceae bacterium]
MPFLKYLLYTVLFSSISGCCNYVDCSGDNYDFVFVVQDTIADMDLVFGANSIYDKSKMKCYSVLGNDTIYYGISFIEYHSSLVDSAISINLFPEVKNEIYLVLDTVDTDTLFATYNSNDTKCCGYITEIVSITINSKKFKINYRPILISK